MPTRTGQTIFSNFSYGEIFFAKEGHDPMALQIRRCPTQLKVYHICTSIEHVMRNMACRLITRLVSYTIGWRTIIQRNLATAQITVGHKISFFRSSDLMNWRCWSLVTLMWGEIVSLTNNTTNTRELHCVKVKNLMKLRLSKQLSSFNKKAFNLTIKEPDRICRIVIRKLIN